MNQPLTYYISSVIPTVDVSKFVRALWRLTQNPAVGIGSEPDPDADTIPDGV
jgi:hypothetical protein